MSEQGCDNWWCTNGWFDYEKWWAIHGQLDHQPGDPLPSVSEALERAGWMSDECPDCVSVKPRSSQEGEAMTYDEAIDAAVRESGLFTLVEPSDAPQALKDKMFEEGRELMRRVFAIFKAVPGSSDG